MNTRCIDLAADLHVGGAGTLGSVLDIELDLLAFLQISYAGLSKITDMAEYVRATFGRRDEAKASHGIEKFNEPRRHAIAPYIRGWNKPGPARQ